MVILPAHSDVMPEQHEVEIAWILARHYTTVIEFLRPTEGYKVKTADFVMNGLIWELKSPTGKSRTTVSNQFKRASKQSSHVIFDSRRIKIDEKEVLKQVHRELQARKSIKAVLFITKTGTVIEIQPVQW
jgi:hypothetical protein